MVLILPGCGPSSEAPHTAESTPAAPAAPPALPPGVTLPAKGITADLTKLTSQPVYNLENVGDIRDPFSKQPINISQSGDLTLTGWAVDPLAKAGNGGVEIAIDGAPVVIKTRLPRSDVAKSLGTPSYADSGFLFTYPAVALSKGPHELKVRILSNDKKSYWEGVGLKLMVQ
jgi:hypothetical protein